MRLIERYGRRSPSSGVPANLLIEGDNLAALGWLEKRYAGAVDLVYVDPPFSLGHEFSRHVSTSPGHETSADGTGLEASAFDDHWAGGRGGYLDMLRDRLRAAMPLLSDRASVYVHSSPRISHYIKVLADDIFAGWEFGEIVWKRTNAHGDRRGFGNVHDVLLYYRRPRTAIWNPQFSAYDAKYKARFRHVDVNGRRFMDVSLSSGRGKLGGGYTYEWNGVTKPWICPEETMARLDGEGRIYYTRHGVARRKHFLDEARGVQATSLWTDISPINSQAHESVGYPTQKPLSLLERIILASSNPDSLVLDFFSGSGTTLVAAQSLDRRWIGCDQSPVAIEATRERLSSGVESFKPIRRPPPAFEILKNSSEATSGHLEDAHRLTAALRAADSEPCQRAHVRLMDIEFDTEPGYKRNARGSIDEVQWWGVDFDHDGDVFNVDWCATRDADTGRVVELSAPATCLGRGQVAVVAYDAAGRTARCCVPWSDCPS